MGIDWIVTPVRSPRASAIVERVIGTLRRECLDHLIVLDEHHLSSVLREFVHYDNAERRHRALGLQAPEPRPRATIGPVRARSVLNGLHHTHERAAWTRRTSCRLTYPRTRLRISGAVLPQCWCTHMTRRPGDTKPEPPGGRAAERRREFLEQRFPGGEPPSEEQTPAAPSEEPTSGEPGAGSEPGQSSAQQQPPKRKSQLGR